MRELRREALSGDCRDATASHSGRIDSRLLRAQSCGRPGVSAVKREARCYGAFMLPADAAAKARSTFDSGKTLPLAFRLERLRALLRAIERHEDALLGAMRQDLHKHPNEAFAELGLALSDLKHHLAHLADWAAPQRLPISKVLFPARAYVQHEPLGRVLIIGPWNYPALLVLHPLIGAVAAGNTVVVKPSELSPATSQAVEAVLRDAFGDDGHVSVVQGGVDVSTQLLAERWDHIFFTGSTQVGKVVMAAAAKHLTPVTLELGGKSPALIDDDVNLDVAAKRIAWSKTYNAGQTCVCVDYVLVHERHAAAFISKVKQAWLDFYGQDPKQSPDFSRIVTPRHAERLQRLMEGGTVAHGGQVDAAERYVAPTLLTDVKLDSPLMQEEIFGPLLPVIPVKSLDEAMAFVRARPKPLGLYVFTENDAHAERVFAQCPSGGAMQNDSIGQIATHSLPFGGVGDSGLGRYHGRHSFETFSNPKSVVRKPAFPDFFLRYAPLRRTPLALWRHIVG